MTICTMRRTAKCLLTAMTLALLLPMLMLLHAPAALAADPNCLQVLDPGGGAGSVSNPYVFLNDTPQPFSINLLATQTAAVSVAVAPSGAANGFTAGNLSGSGWAAGDNSGSITFNVDPAGAVADAQATFEITGEIGGPATPTTPIQFAVRKAYHGKDITTFSIPNMTGSAVINTTAHTVSVEMPAGTALTSLTPTIAVSQGASISPQSTVAQNFTSPVTYTVTAENGATQNWTVTVTNAAGSSANDITGFTFSNIVGSAVIGNNTVTATAKYGTSLTSIAPTITVSPKAAISPASGAAQNFTSPVTYTVTAEDGSQKTYSITIAAQNASSAKYMDYFAINGHQGVISGTTITVDMPYGTNKASLIPTYQYVGNTNNPPVMDGGTLLGSNVAHNFTNPRSITIYAQDGSSITYTVTVNVPTSSSDCLITAFTIPNMTGSAIINNTSNTITITMPMGTSLTALVPTITVSAGATVYPASLVAQNFTNAIAYTVTAADGTKRVYTVSVTVDGGSSAQTLTHASTGVKVTGTFASGATLAVTENALHSAGSCTACDHIRSWMVLKHVVKCYNVVCSSSSSGNVTVSLPLGTNSYDGRTLTMLHCNGGILERSNAIVYSGTISASFSSLSPFAVLDGVYTDISNDVGGTDPPKTGDEAIYAIWGELLVTLSLLLSVLCGMVLVHKRQRKML